MSEDELWASANEMLRHHGEDAMIVAAQKADERMEQADLDGVHKWLAVVKRINILLERPHGPLH